MSSHLMPILNLRRWGAIYSLGPQGVSGDEGYKAKGPLMLTGTRTAGSTGPWPVTGQAY